MMYLRGESLTHHIIQMSLFSSISASIPWQLICPLYSDLGDFFWWFYRSMTKLNVYGDIPNLSSSSSDFSVS